MCGRELLWFVVVVMQLSFCLYSNANRQLATVNYYRSSNPKLHHLIKVSTPSITSYQFGIFGFTCIVIYFLGSDSIIIIVYDLEWKTLRM